MTATLEPTTTALPPLVLGALTVDPALQPVGAPGQLAACHLHGVVGRPVEREDAVAAPAD